MDAPVIVVGAGLAGLTLAGELRLGGVEVILLERLAEPTRQSRGRGLTIRTMEMLDQRGLLKCFGEIETTDVGHFGRVLVDLSVLDGGYLPNLTVGEAQIEAVMGRWAADLGTDIRRGHEVLRVVQDDDGVDVQVRGPEGEHLLRAAYLVGCDGPDSTVRESGGFSFPGTVATLEMYLAEVRGIDISPRTNGQNTPGGGVGVFRFTEGITRLIVYERTVQPERRPGPVDFGHVSAAWKRLTGEDISSGVPLWARAFSDEAHLATEYRKGRIMVAGNAAHIQLPVGSLGMHTALQDSMNLGWKLAAVARGSAQDGLLDTYHSERHPVGERLLRDTQAQARLAFSGDEGQPLRDVLAELIGYEAVNRHLALMVSGLDIAYEVGPGDHPLLGRRMPHQELVGKEGKTTSTTELLRAGRGVLLDCADDAGLRSAAAPWARRVDIITAFPHQSGSGTPLTDLAAVLIRPDGYVVWLPMSRDDLPTVLERWFGPSRRAFGLA